MSGRCYTFGAFHLDSGKRLLTRDGAPVPLSARAFDVLLVLVERHGTVVEKDDLIREVWRGAHIDENNIPRAISTLRRALDDARGANRWIVTIPGRGYQFIGDVVEGAPATAAAVDAGVDPNGLDAGKAQDAGTAQDIGTAQDAVVRSRSSTPQAAGGWPQRRLPLARVAAAAVVLPAIATLLAWGIAGVDRRVETSAPDQIWQLTFSPGLEGEPAWSPDGRMVAFSSNRGGNLDIWVQSIDGGNAIRVTSSPAHDWQPDWSKDGRIVFRSERDGGGLWVVPALGGAERQVADFGYHPRWSPDGSRILFHQSNFQGRVLAARELYTVALDGAPPRKVMVDALDEFTSFSAAWHPDSARVSIWGVRLDESAAFVTAAVESGSPVVSDLGDTVRQRLASGALRLTNPDNVPLPFRWAPAGDALYFEGISRGVRNLWRIPVNPASLRWGDDVRRLTTSADLNEDIALSPDGSRLAFAVRNERIRLWSFGFDSASATLLDAGTPLTAPTFDALSPVLSHDGRMLVYEAERGGQQELRLRLPDGSERLLVEGDGNRRVSPVWSDDDSRVAYVRNRLNGEDPASESQVVSVPVSGGAETVVSTPVPIAQLFDWAADGRWLLASLRPKAGEPFRLAMIEGPTPADVRVVATDTVSNLWKARLSPDRRWITFTGVSSPGRSAIYVVPAAGGERIKISSGDFFDDRSRWSPDGRLIYFVSNRGGFLNLWSQRFDPERGAPVGEPVQLTRFDSPERMIPARMVQLGLALAPDRLILPISEASGNIWILDGIGS